MGKLYDEITPELHGWISNQQMFFVATAPLDAQGLINCSPKGMDTFRIIGPTCVAYLDLTGSGAETIAHLRENGRIVFMFCAFEGPPNIVRLYGKGNILTPSCESWEEHRSLFPDYPGARSIIRVDVTRISDSCGYSVPLYEYVEQRKTLENWATKQGEEAVNSYQQEKNLRSIDGLPALDPK